MAVSSVKPRLSQIKCNKCYKSIHCLGQTPEKISSLLEEEIGLCKNRYRQDYMECGLKTSLKLYNKMHPMPEKKLIPALLQNKHAKAEAEEAAVEIDMETGVVRRVSLEETRDKEEEELADEHACAFGAFSVRDKRAIEQESCAWDYYSNGLIKNVGVEIIGKEEDGTFEISAPDPIRILVSKKGSITIVESE